jgi:hypothetical protein
MTDAADTGDGLEPIRVAPRQIDLKILYARCQTDFCLGKVSIFRHATNAKAAE